MKEKYVKVNDIINIKGNDRLRDQIMKLIDDEVLTCHDK